MSFTKADIVDAIQHQLGLPKNQSTELVERIFETIKTTLTSREDVLVK